MPTGDDNGTEGTGRNEGHDRTRVTIRPQHAHREPQRHSRIISSASRLGAEAGRRAGKTTPEGEARLHIVSSHGGITKATLVNSLSVHCHLCRHSYTVKL